MKKPTSFLIDEKNANRRLDIFLHSLFPEFSRSLLAKHILRNAVLVNKITRKPSYILKPNDCITLLSIPDSSDHTPLIANTSLDIPLLFEDENILVIDKPSGIQVHPSSAEKEKTIVNWLIGKYPDIREVGEDPFRPGIVHRLDKDTSGILVIAKTQKSFIELKKLFANRKIQKEYTAIVHGVPVHKSGTINKPIARATTFRKQTVTEKHSNWKGTPREAITDYEIIREIPETTKIDASHLPSSPVFQGSRYSLLTLHPHTGRMHQIRVHLSSIGNPVVGDTLYNRKEFRTHRSANRQLLHATKINFSLFGKRYSLESSLPKDFQEFFLPISHN